MDDDAVSPSRARMGRLIDDRRKALDLTQREVARHSVTYGNLIAGRSVKRETVERAFRRLGWDPDSINDVLAGGNPRPLANSSTDSEPIYAFEDGASLLEGIAGNTPEERRTVLMILERGRRRLRGDPQVDNSPPTQ